MGKIFIYTALVQFNTVTELQIFNMRSEFELYDLDFMVYLENQFTVKFEGYVYIKFVSMCVYTLLEHLIDLIQTIILSYYLGSCETIGAKINYSKWKRTEKYTYALWLIATKFVQSLFRTPRNYWCNYPKLKGGSKSKF